MKRGRLHLVKKKRKPKIKVEKLEFSEECDYCRKPLQVCRVRNAMSFGLALAAGQPAATFQGVPRFFCSDECLKAFTSRE